MEVLIVKTEISSKEKDYNTWNGCTMLILNFILFFISIILIIIGGIFSPYILIIGIPLFIFSNFIWSGLFTVYPNNAVVLSFYGTYKGTVKINGFHWVNPFYSFTKYSLRCQILDGQQIKVNDKIGNPVIIATNLIWRISDTAKAAYDVVNLLEYVRIQNESAVRHLASCFPYDKHKEDDKSLLSSHEAVSVCLLAELKERMFRAGVEVLEARITHLSYAPEIAGAMLRVQQASAVIAAREKIVTGAVAIVGHALTALKQNDIVDLKDDDRAKLVSNLLVVLCSESAVHPVVNTGN